MGMSIILADDHTMFREGLRALLERERDMTVVAEAADGQSAVERTLEMMPDVVVMDINMPKLSGIEAAREIHDQAPDVGIVILTMHGDKHYLVESLKLGVRSFILKDWASDELVVAVRSVFSKISYLSPRLSDIIISGFAETEQVPRKSLLTAREEQALRLLASGKNCKEVAYDLRISSKTVETYRLNVMKKLHLSNMAQLVAYAMKKGICTPS